jgi:hypothetical protein
MHRSRTPVGFIDKYDNQREMFDTLAKRLGIKDLDGWYTLTSQRMRHYGYYGILQEYEDVSHKTFT